MTFSDEDLKRLQRDVLRLNAYETGDEPGQESLGKDLKGLIARLEAAEILIAETLEQNHRAAEAGYHPGFDSEWLGLLDSWRKSADNEK